jgi:enhancing lycopene biosynthesis protein 2
VLTLLELDLAGCEITCTAPDTEQKHVINHLTQQPVSAESRNVLVESARIARGKIVPLSDLDVSTLDAIVLPGGYGAAKNLSTFALDGTAAAIQPDVEAKLKEAHAQGKVLGFLCISPAIAAQLFGPRKVEFTIGTDPETAKALQTWGAIHKECPVDGVVVDKNLRIVSSPAYMLGTRISEVYAGIREFVRAVLSLC